MLDQFERAGLGVVVISGGSGSGKSVLAEQIAERDEFEVTLWVDCGGRRIAWDGSLRSKDGGPLPATVTASSARLGGAEPETGAVSKRTLQSYRTSRVCLVLDDAVVDEDSDLAALYSLLVVVTHGASRLVITTRSIDLLPFHGIEALHVQGRDLRLSLTETVEVISQCAGRPLCEGDAERLLEASGGQIGLLAVLCRHALLEQDESHALPVLPVDFRLELERLAVVSLSQQQLLLLHAMSLMSAGSLQELEGIVDLPDRRWDLQTIAEAIPLVRAFSSVDGQLRFRVHAMAQAVFACPTFASLLPTNAGELRLRVMGHLSRTARYPRLQTLLAQLCEADEIADWLEDSGKAVLLAGELGLLRCALARVPQTVSVSRPRLMLLGAALLRETGEYADALRQARVARDVAEHEGERQLLVDSMLLIVRLAVDTGDAVTARDVSLQLLSFVEGGQRALTCSYLAAATGWMGDVCGARAWVQDAETILDSCHMDESVRDEIVGRLAATEAMVLGEFGAAMSRFSQVVESATATLATRILALGNLAVALSETGRLTRAEEAARRAMDLCNIDSEDAQPVLYHNLEAVLSVVRGGQDRIAEGLQLVEASTRDSLRHADVLDSAVNLAYGAAMRRAAGDVEQARDEAEIAVEMLTTLQAPLFLWVAEAELAACELAAGERVVARARADRLAQALEGRGGTLYAVRARLVLAAAALPDAPHEAVQTLAAYREQILSGNANWVLAMYMRAFPGLLGVVASVVGAECVPAHILRMLPPATIRAGLAEAEGMLTPDDWAALARRLGSSDEMDRRAEDAHAVSPCRVRLFGGLQVSTGDGPVHDADWKKRKARLLFAMLVVRKGKDVPRDQLLEYLWPDMDNDRARANFYVVWNNMKRALSPNLEKGKPSPYMRAAGGVCRVDDILVSTDLDDFEQCLLDARRAESQDDRAGALDAYRHLADIYRGDLLPGDIYDDWFAPLRERCRQEFGDAMLRAGAIHAAGDDHASALRMIRAALTYDPWREDLYQAALRSQIASGQRSAAINTYMTCMHRLSEDLGIDPSAETRRLYDHVLSMEDGPAEGVYGG